MGLFSHGSVCRAPEVMQEPIVNKRDVKEDLKTGIDLLMEFDKKLSELHWDAQRFILSSLKSKEFNHY